MSTLKIIFEDNPDMSISRLISKYSLNGINIYFSGGNTEIIEKLSSIYNKDDSFCIFYDISPENGMLISRYYSLIENIRNNIADYNENVYIIPVICTEYVVLKMLSFYKYIDSNIEYAIGEKIDYDKLMNSTRQRTMEKAYKYILKHLNIIYHNINEVETKDIGNKGEFYRTGNLKLKSEQILASFPVMHIIDEDHKLYLKNNGIIYTNKTINDIVNEINNLYDYIFNEAGKNRIKFNILVSK